MTTTPMTDTPLETLALAVQLPAFAGTSLPAEYAALLAEGLGGVCYFGSNTADGPEAVARLSAAIRAANPHAVIAVDEEGGDVTRLHAVDGSPVLGPAALGAADDLELTRETGRAIGAELAAVGVNLNFGPVADVNSNPDNPVIGTRSFGTEAGAVAAQVAAWVGGHQEAGAAACAKHFPGHGDTAQDSHLELPTVDADPATLRARELVPFAAVVEARVAAVMTSHIVVPALDPDLPGTLSAPVLGLLRDELGYDGVIVSDALDMAGASAGRGIPEAAVLSLAAGADLLCIGPDKPASLVRRTQAAIVAAVHDGRLSRARLESAAARIARMLDELSPVTAYDIDAERQRAAARRAVTVEGELPDLRDAVVVSVETAANIAVGEVPWGLVPDRTLTPGEPLEVDPPVILQVRDAHRRPEIVTDGAAVVVEWGWPGPYDGPLPRILTRGYSRPMAAAVTELLREAGWSR
ncbi:glycoside hydrolase family 3 N-terminal domain-containing protein [Nocardioides sp. YIM 152315]|uniref:glycoside hydrolase family 3 protein n=1 Tax=Nocardioides sp. YIM 152315 TaxID=3031760 RepID=UPI0023DA5012|nr:glycoside hydrolase family 3 N-terminal domain-containing protein [Nocardioides sp. YIM 152315]MDF1604250.1 glycoside hydrolase family 3 N-terminal domain-containing protein [Nocardioides sp. YIM 152315]